MTDLVIKRQGAVQCLGEEFSDILLDLRAAGKAIFMACQECSFELVIYDVPPHSERIPISEDEARRLAPRLFE